MHFIYNFISNNWPVDISDHWLDKKHQLLSDINDYKELTKAISAILNLMTIYVNGGVAIVEM